MAQPYAWTQLDKQTGSLTISGRSGHTIVKVGSHFICYGGMDGRKDSNGRTMPNSDTYILSLDEGAYTWSQPPKSKDASHSRPPVRTSHAATVIDDKKVFIFGGQHSCTPFRALNDSWLLDTDTFVWTNLGKYTNENDQKSAQARPSRIDSKMLSPIQSSTTHSIDKRPFHEKLISIVTSSLDDSLFPGVKTIPPGAAPCPRYGHSCATLDSDKILLFGGYGGFNYSRNHMNDIHIFNLTTNEWSKEIVCTGTPPSGRSGHGSSLIGQSFFVFGGINAETQMNDLYVLDVAKMDWSDLDLTWSIPRWNLSSLLVPALPNPKWFLFGGSVDDRGETTGRCFGSMDSRIGVLDIKDIGQMSWDEPILEDRIRPPAREESSILYDHQTSRLIIFGGWGKTRWLDDVWAINISTVTGPPYALYAATPPTGPVSGKTLVTLRGIGFQVDTTCTVRIIDSTSHQSVEISDTTRIVSDTEIQFVTPPCLSFVDCQIRVRLSSLTRVYDWTSTYASFKFYLNTIPQRSLCYGPGILQEGELGCETMFVIQARNRLGENRLTGGDTVSVVIHNHQPTTGAPPIIPVVQDLLNGRYIVKYTPSTTSNTDSLSLDITVLIEDDQGVLSHVRGSPFKASFCLKPKHKKSNCLSGPLVSLFIVHCLKEMDDIVKKTESEVSLTPAPNDVKSIIRVSNQIREFYEKEHHIALLQDQVLETLSALEAEGIQNDKASKQLRKTIENISTVREKCKLKEMELSPLIEAESNRYRHLIVEEFERKGLKSFVDEIATSPVYLYATGIEKSKSIIQQFTHRLETFRVQFSEYKHISTAFGYCDLLCKSQQVLEDISSELKALTSMWDHVAERSSVCQIYMGKSLLGGSSSSVNPDEMEETIKSNLKNLRENIKINKEKDCYICETNVLKKWMQFVPLLFDLRDQSMRERHWKDLETILSGRVSLVNPSKVTVGQLWDAQLYGFSDQIGEIADQAKQEYKMEKFLDKLTAVWTVLQFQSSPHRGDDRICTLKLADDDFEQLEDHQVQVQNMFASRFFSTFEQPITHWQKSLSNINEIATLLSEVIRSWTFLENLFVYSEEVKKELPEDSERFKLIDKEIREILVIGRETTCLKFCNLTNMFDRIDKCMRMLSVCEKSLNEFMDGKRRAFPRFYFVSMVDLLDILSNGNTPSKVMVHMSKIFQAIKTYRLEDTSLNHLGQSRPIAIGIESCINDEYVPFPTLLTLDGKVEIYLDKTISTTRETLRHYSKQTLEQYTQAESRTKWLEESPVAQCAILVNLVSWVSRVEKSFASCRQGLVEARNQSNTMLLDLIRMTQRTDLDRGTRQKLMCLITLDAHNRDVQDRLINENVVSADAFQWQAQLKAYWDEERNTAILKIADAQFEYGYEYLGNGPRLVVTPLTDRIYVTCTQALHLGMGCAPAGPAGTGKTETTKDLANALGKACFVFNSSPEVDYKSMGDLFKGLASSGSFGCFDEFNRLIPEVLSVCSIQFKAICDAIRSKADRFLLQGDEISLDRSCGVFITMNPGYLGRSTLPESLSSLFRPVTVMVADYNLIISNCLMSEGFLESDKLAKKFSTLYALCSDLLSKAKQYDWGMRAIKSVLVVAGSFKRADPNLSEEAVLMRALRDTNIAKIDGDDLKIFMGLLNDLFPGIDAPRARNLTFEQTISETIDELGYTNDDYLMLKITQLNELLSIRHCIFMMGNPGSFKSAVWRILAKAKEKIGEPVLWTDINPKAISTQELYGYVNMTTREWKDGILSKTMRNFANDTSSNPKWIILDGDLDANWIESMNSVMDDNKLLTLPSNERISLKPNMRLIFEIRDLNFATPATVTRAGVVSMIDHNGVQWRCYQMSWIKRKRNDREEEGAQAWDDTILNTLSACFDKYCPEVLLYMKKFCETQIPIVDIAIVQSLCRMLDSVLGSKLSLVNPTLAESVFVLCLIWSAGGCLGEVDGVDYRKNFSNWWRSSGDIAKMNVPIKFPSTLRSGASASIFDFFVNLDAGGRIEEWSSIVPSVNYTSDIPMSLVTIPTAETVANSYFAKALMSVGYPVMFIGASGCGKTQQCRGIILDAQLKAYNINMNYYTDSSLLQSMMEAPLEKKAGRLFAPPGNQKLVYFIDDLNMPALDPYNTQSAISLLRQYQDYGHWYDRSKISLKDIGNTQLLCSMNPTAGSFTIDQRLQRHFWTCSVSSPDVQSLTTIFSTYTKGHFERLPFKSAVYETVSTIIKSAMNLHQSMTKTFRKTAVNFHYEFNLRHMTGVFQGLLQVRPENAIDVESIVSLWIHESDRVYSDRLMTVGDVKKYKAVLGDVVRKNFGAVSSKIVPQIESPFGIVYTPFSKGWDAVGDGAYDKIPSTEKLADLVNNALKEYNESNPVMDLVLFEDALKHVARISRIISRPSGHALLVGVGGSGRQSLARLAAFITKSTATSVVISSSYSLTDFRTDLQSMYTKAGIKDERIVFIFSDTQITNEKFLVYINDLLSTGDIADLYTNEEKDAIRNSVRSAAKAASVPDTPETLWQYFINRIKSNLHMCLCFSPVGDSMRTWARKFPALVNCTVIDWFHPWPKDALKSVASKYIGEMELGVFGNSVDIQRAIIDFIPYSFEVAAAVSEKYTLEERKFAYTTPKSFLELLKLYRDMLVAKQDSLRSKRDRLTRGLSKLRSTQEQVSKLELELMEKAVVVVEKAKAAEIFAERVGAEKVIVNAEADKAAIEKSNCEEIASVVSAQQRSCEDDLSKAIPLVEKAEAALDVLNKKDFQELKSFAKPPPGVDKVCEACMYLLAGFDGGSIEVDKRGKVKDANWKGSQKMMANPEKFLDNLKSFKSHVDASRVPQSNIDSARPLTLEPDFTVESMTKKSKAAAGLCEWVLNIIMYYDVYQSVEPKKQALREATAKLDTANAKLAEVQALVSELETKLGKLVAEYDAAMAEKNSVIEEAEKCKLKLSLAKRLIGALGANGGIWESSIASITEELTRLPGDVVLACCFVSYTAVFDRKHRDECMNQMIEYLRSGKQKIISFSEPFDVLKILTNEADIARWQTEGLPSDRVSCENGAIITNSQRWCLLIDPQLQGLAWIKNKFGSDLVLLRLNMPPNKLMTEFESAIENGKTVLIENMGESVDAFLQPIISRNVIKRGRNKYMKLGEKEVLYNPSFRLIMHTKLANPHYPPEIHAECTVINFTVTEKGLEEQLLFLVVKLERPELAKQKLDLINSQNEFKVKLIELENLLLEKLANAKGNVLEDIELIESLEAAKFTSDEVVEKVAIAKKTEIQINSVSDIYRPCANRSSLLFFYLNDLRRIHPFYKYSLEGFVQVVTRAITSTRSRPLSSSVGGGAASVASGGRRSLTNSIKLGSSSSARSGSVGSRRPQSEDGDDASSIHDFGSVNGGGDEEGGSLSGRTLVETQSNSDMSTQDIELRVELLIKSITRQVFMYVSRGLFEHHKITAASILCLRTLARSGTITSAEVDALIRCHPKQTTTTTAVPENVKSWISETVWGQLKSLESLVPQIFKNLCQNIESETLSWKRWFGEEKIESVDLPRAFREIGQFHKLILIRILRPDRLFACLISFVSTKMGSEYIDRVPLDMDKAYMESSPNNPLFFVLFPGSDPTPAVETLAKRMGVLNSGKFVNISMGQGQETIAINALNNCAKEGGWIMLQNIHLMQSWLKVLQQALDSLEGTAHAEFRCILTSEPPAVVPGGFAQTIPDSILQKSVKIADEAPSDIKSNLKRAWGRFSQAMIDSNPRKKDLKACLFALCFFHSVVVGRRKFGPQGWSRNYPFSDGDLLICASVLENYLAKSDNVPWSDIRYIFGEIMYGGHVTDQWDMRVTNTYLSQFIVPDLLGGNTSMVLAPGVRNPDSSKMEYNAYMKFIDERLPNEAPQLFGMHSNSEIRFLTNQSNTVLETIQAIAGGSVSTASTSSLSNPSASIQQLITVYLNQLPKNFDMLAIRSKITEWNPYIIVALQESERMNVLLSEIRRSLTELEMGLSGALNMSDKMEDLMKNLTANKVFGNWEKLAYSSLKPLSAWMNDLCLRASQLTEWTSSLKTPKSVWISGLFNPMSYLTAVMQVTARQHGLPLDQMTLRCVFTNHKDPRAPDLAHPNNGVYIHGLFMEGAAWEEGKGEEEGYITDSKPKVIHPVMPVMNVVAVPITEMDWDSMYKCPVYITSSRGATYTFTANVRMEPDDHMSKWILSGAALLLTDD